MSCPECRHTVGHHSWCSFFGLPYAHAQTTLGKFIKHTPLFANEICTHCNGGSGLHHWECPYGGMIPKKIEGNLLDPVDPFGPDIERAYEGIFDGFKHRDLCGVFPFELPALFPLTPCCIKHDTGYIKTRAKFIENYLIDKTILDRIEDYKTVILGYDNEFYACTMDFLNNQPWFIKPFLQPFVYAFNRLVKELGWKVWVGGTLAAIQDLETNGHES